MGRKLFALCAVLLLMQCHHAHAQTLEIPGVGASSRDVRPAAPATEHQAETPTPAELELPPSVTAPVELDLRQPAVIGPAGTLPDELTAGEITYEPDGTLVLKDVKLTVSSMLRNGGPAIVSANFGRLNARTQQLELSGGLSIALQNLPQGIDAELSAQAATWDGEKKRLSVQGLELPVPLRAVLGDDFPASEIEARFVGHTRLNVPEHVYVNAGELEVVQRGKEQIVVLREVEVAPTARPGGDLYITASEVTYGGQQELRASGIGVYLEGVKLLTWPGYSRSSKQGSGILELDAPKLSVDASSIEAREDIAINLHPFHAETRVAYAEDFDVIAHTFAYVDAWEGAQLGVQHGDIQVADFERNSYLRGDNMVLTARQYNDWGDWRTQLDFEQGDVSMRSIGAGGLGDLVSVSRTAARADVELTRAQLGGDWYFTGGATAAQYDYGVERYEVLGYRAGLIQRQGGFNNFLLYRENQTEGAAVLPFDAVRRRELDFQARSSLIPRLSHIVRAVYDFDLEDFDRLELATLIERRGYEVGFYWDFARDSAGLELGLFTP
jgi:hypothetical protein